MNRDDMERRFADRYDGALGPDEFEQFESELQDSAAHAADWQSYRDAIEALREHGTAETSPELRTELLAAVDLAAREQASRRWPLVPLSVGIAVGAAAAALLFVFLPGLRHVELVPKVIERTVEIPVETVRTERVEVPVEVVRIKQIEVPVEVPVRVEVPVPQGPLLEIDSAPIVAAVDRLADRLADGIAIVGHDIGESLARSATRIREPAKRIPESRGPDSRRRRPGSVPSPATGIAAAQGEVRIREFGGRVRIETSGPLSEYIPVLIGQLEMASPAVRTAIEDRLASVHARANEDPELRGQLVAPRPRGPREIKDAGNIFRNGRRRSRIIDESPAERWSAWWDGNARLLVAAAFE